MTRITLASVVSAYVESAQSDVTARDAAEKSIKNRITRAVITAQALDCKITAKSISEGLVDAVNGNPILKAELNTSTAQVIMEAWVGRIYMLDGALPTIKVGVGAAAEDVEIGPRQVLALVRKVNQQKGAGAKVLRKIDTAADRADAIKILSDGLAAAVKAADDAADAAASADDAADAADDAVTTDDTMATSALDKIKNATALITEVLDSEQYGETELAALRALVSLISDRADMITAELAAA